MWEFYFLQIYVFLKSNFIHIYFRNAQRVRYKQFGLKSVPAG